MSITHYFWFKKKKVFTIWGVEGRSASYPEKIKIKVSHKGPSENTGLEKAYKPTYVSSAACVSMSSQLKFLLKDC